MSTAMQHSKPPADQTTLVIHKDQKFLLKADKAGEDSHQMCTHKYYFQTPNLDPVLKTLKWRWHVPTNLNNCQEDSVKTWKTKI
jgi:hypothetical protein